MSEEKHGLLYDRSSRSRYLNNRDENEEAAFDGGKERTDTVQQHCIGFDETKQFGNILETIPTVWITVGLWSQ